LGAQIVGCLGNALLLREASAISGVEKGARDLQPTLATCEKRRTARRTGTIGAVCVSILRDALRPQHYFK
jgi:hypothetical protein